SALTAFANLTAFVNGHLQVWTALILTTWVSTNACFSQPSLAEGVPLPFVRFVYGYNFFWGADSLATTARGMGSISPGLYGGTRVYFDRFHLAFGAGIHHFEYRLAQNRLPFYDGETFSAPLDQTPGRERPKSKISWLGLRLIPEFGATFGKFSIALAGHFDLLLHARHKYRYRSSTEGTISRKLIGNKHLHTLPFKAGFSLLAEYMGIGVFVSWFPTPVFGPDAPRFSSFQAGLSLSAILDAPPRWKRKDGKT
ncbi:MAG: hypothetical protein RMM53_03955, partial [Bacteroidia bacterium]|nr:hypothetical protein [Bacteroidia bacterium]MDW8333350.1 hypothetical protein [Bacteroidia bacterium]